MDKIEVIELSMTKNGVAALYEVGGAVNDGSYGFSKIIASKYYLPKTHVYSPMHRTPNGEHALFHVCISDHIITAEVKVNEGKISAEIKILQIVAMLQDYKAMARIKEVSHFDTTTENIDKDMANLPQHIFAAISKAIKPKNKTIEFTDWAKYNKQKVLRFVKERQFVDMTQFTEKESNQILLDMSNKQTLNEAVRSLEDVQYKIVFEGTRIKSLVPDKEIDAIYKCA